MQEPVHGSEMGGKFTGLSEVKCKSLPYVAAKDHRRLSFPRGMCRITKARIIEMQRMKGVRKAECKMLRVLKEGSHLL